MAVLIAGLILFFGVHSVRIVANGWVERSIDRMGRAPWTALYSLVAIVGVVLIVYGYGLARQTPEVLYAPPVWLRHLSMLLLVPVFPLLFAAYLPGRIQTLARHPMLVATKLWAVAHLLANGTVADVLLFGGFLVWAVADRISLKHRSGAPVPALPRTAFNDVIAVVAGLALYVAFVLWLHAALIGVAPVSR